MNSKSLKAKIRNLSRETHIDSHALMQNYFLERLLVRLSFCDYKENIIIKGGMLIASLIGSGQRSTMDLDATIKQFPMREADISRMIKEIIEIDVEDNIEYRFIGIEAIREEDDYNGFRIKVDAYFERVIQHLKIDLSTGDMITPGAIDYLYRPMFGDDAIQILTYNLETIIAEKYETVISRGTANTRMRDFYDLYALKALRQEELDFSLLSQAVENTSAKRDTLDLLMMSQDIIQLIDESEVVRKLWKAYRDNYFYAKEIEFNQIIEAVRWYGKNIRI